MDAQLIVPVIFLGGSVALGWKWLDARHQQRMAIIEKGTPSADLKNPMGPMFRVNPLSNLKWGMIAIFIGVGVMLANYLHHYLFWGEEVYPATIMICGGLALVIFYFIANMKEKKEKAEGV